MVLLEQYAHGHFCWVDVMSKGIDEVAPFYEGLFDWQAVKQETPNPEMPYTIFQYQGEVVAGLGQMNAEMESSGMPACWNSYINVDDIQASVDRAVELGANLILPAFDIPGAGYEAIIADPTGAPIALWQKQNHFGASYVNHPSGWCWNELITDDLPTAVNFFEDLFDWKVTPTPEDENYLMAVNQGRNNCGFMKKTAEMGPMPNCWGVYFSVENIDASVAKVVELGGQIMVPSIEASVGKISVVADPHGAVFNLIQMSIPVDE